MGLGATRLDAFLLLYTATKFEHKMYIFGALVINVSTSVKLYPQYGDRWGLLRELMQRLTPMVGYLNSLSLLLISCSM